MRTAVSELQPAYVLHTRDLSEDSLLCELLSRDGGRHATVARGARRSRKGRRALLQAFRPLMVAWQGSGELTTLTTIEPAGSHPRLIGTAIYCGLYLNELLMRLLRRDDPHPELFRAYSEAVGALGDGGDPEPVLRRFEHRLLEEMGWGVDLLHDWRDGRSVDPEARYLLRAEHGFERLSVQDPKQASYGGATLLALADEALQTPEALREARHLMRRLLEPHLGGRPLKTREALESLRDIGRRAKAKSEDAGTRET